MKNGHRRKTGNSAHNDLLRGIPETRLSLEQESALSDKIQASKKSDEDSINALALHNLREAFYYALACSKTLPPDDVYSLCYAALRYAATNFKYRGARFFPYSKAYIRGEIYKTFNDRNVVKDAICEPLRLGDEEMVREIEESENGHPLSLRRPRNFIEPTVESDLHGIVIRDEWGRIKPIFRDKLSEKERMVLELKFEGGFNFREIGDLLRVSRSDTQATHTRALRKVRCVLMRKKALFNRHQ